MRRKLQIIFQDPYSSLNPRMTVYDLISAPLEVYKVGDWEERREMVEEILQEVGLDKQYLNRFPHEFSGGQRQRIGIARALILNPEFVVCDEAVSALDVSVRAQVLNLMRNMQQKKNLTYLFISHDLSVVRHISDSIAVMYLGSVVEVAEKSPAYYSNPMHPYTKALLSAIPLPDVKKKRAHHSGGDVPVPTIRRQDASSIPAVPMQQTAAGRKLLCFRRWKRGIKQPATGLWSLPENLFPAICRLHKCDVHFVESLFKHVLESAE